MSIQPPTASRKPPAASRQPESGNRALRSPPPTDPLARLAAILGEPAAQWLKHRVTDNGSHVVMISTGQKYTITPAQLESGLDLKGNRLP